MYKIGDFSKIVNISVRTLRYYDECGILVPSEIDEFTGYRYYNDENIIECELIKLLKSLDFTLEEIFEYKDCIDETVIKRKKKEIEERMYLLKLKYERLTLMEKELQTKGSILNQNKNKEVRVLRRNINEKRIIRKDT